MREHKKKINEMIIRAQIIYNEEYAEKYGKEEKDGRSTSTGRKG